MSSDQISGLLGLAARARRISTGDTAFQQLRSHKVYLMIMSDTIGDNSRKKLNDKCTFYHVPLVSMNEETMNRAIGTSNRKFVAILDEGFAQKLHACLKG